MEKSFPFGVTHVSSVFQPQAALSALLSSRRSFQQQEATVNQELLGALSKSFESVRGNFEQMKAATLGVVSSPGFSEAWKEAAQNNLSYAFIEGFKQSVWDLTETHAKLDTVLAIPGYSLPPSVGSHALGMRVSRELGHNTMDIRTVQSVEFSPDQTRVQTEKLVQDFSRFVEVEEQALQAVEKDARAMIEKFTAPGGGDWVLKGMVSRGQGNHRSSPSAHDRALAGVAGNILNGHLAPSAKTSSPSL